MKRNLFGILTTLTLALLISVPLSAQTIAKATVPFDFTVGQTQMPAGTYEISPLSQRDFNQGQEDSKECLEPLQLGGT